VEEEATLATVFGAAVEWAINVVVMTFSKTVGVVTFMPTVNLTA